MKKDLNLNEFHKVEKVDYIEAINETDYQKRAEIQVKKALKKKQADQMADMRDTQYYCVLVFCNKADKTEFLSQVNEEIEIQGETFIDGYQFAEKHFKSIECSASLPLPHFAKEIRLIQTQKKMKLK